MGDMIRDYIQSREQRGCIYAARLDLWSSSWDTKYFVTIAQYGNLNGVMV